MDFHSFLQDLANNFNRESPKLKIDIAMEKTVWYRCGKVVPNGTVTKERWKV